MTMPRSSAYVFFFVFEHGKKASSTRPYCISFNFAVELLVNIYSLAQAFRRSPNQCLYYSWIEKTKNGMNERIQMPEAMKHKTHLCFSAPALRSRFVEKFSLCLLLASRKTEYNISTMPDKQTVNVRFAPLFVAPCRYGDISLTFLKSLRFSVGFCAHTSWECDAV